MENDTSLNSTSFQFSLNRFYLFPLGFLIPMYIFSISVFWRCKKLVKTLRFWFQFVLVSTLVTFLFCVITRTQISEGMGSNLISYRILNGIMTVGSRAVIMGAFALGCEQLCSLKFAMTYQKYTTTPRLLTCGICIYIISVVTSLTGFVGEIQSEKLKNITEAASWSQYLLSLIFSCLIITVYGVIGFIAVGKSRETKSKSLATKNDYSSFIKVTIKSTILAIAYGVFFLPISIVEFACFIDDKCMEWIDNLILPKVVMSVLFYTSLPVILVSNCYESRHIALKTLCRCRKAYMQRLEMKYRQNYATFKLATISRPAQFSREAVQQNEEIDF